MFNLSVYSGHNASFTIAKDDEVLEVLEVERFLNYKNSGLLWYLPAHDPKKVIKSILDYFQKKYNVDVYENLITNQDDTRTYINNFGDQKTWLEFFNAKNLIEVFHQEGHSYGAFYQSDLENAIIASFDGGGNDGCFNFYESDRVNGLGPVTMNYDYNLGEKYAEIGHYCSSIRTTDWSRAYLVYAGKLMGLAGYGKYNEVYEKELKEFYKGHHMTREAREQNYIDGLKNPLNLPDELGGDIEKDLVFTSQKVFEDIFIEESKEFIEKSNDNFIITGGCGLNILNNTRVNKLTKTFIPPNPNDAGLSFGFMMKHLKPKEAVDITYLGPDVWDKHTLSEYFHEYRGREFDYHSLATGLTNGKIVGVVRGRSEIGPRALGNRSILCDPTINGMKDTLNQKVKNREYYRPFAPVVRLEDVNKYFEFDQESRWMSFCPNVRQEYRDILKEVTHVDGTARVQTVTREQHPFLYDLLTKMDEIKGIGVLLNTSFNVAGKPILNTYRDAVDVWQKTDMDSLILEDFYFEKK